MKFDRKARTVLALMVVAVAAAISGCNTDELVQKVGAVRGRVTDNAGAAVSSAVIRVDGSNYSALTNTDGEYVMNLPSGSYTLTASKDGLGEASTDVTIGSGEQGDVVADFTLSGQSGGFPRLSLRLDASQRVYYYGNPIELRLVVKNEGSAPVRLGGDGSPWEVKARSEEGWLVWTEQAPVETVDLAPGEEKVFACSWQWYEHPLERPVRVMLMGRVHPVFNSILPRPLPYVDPSSDGGTGDEGSTESPSGDGEGEDGDVETTSSAMHGHRILPPEPIDFVTEPIFIKLHPEGKAEPVSGEWEGEDCSRRFFDEEDPASWKFERLDSPRFQRYRHRRHECN